MGIDANALLTSNPSPLDVMLWLDRHEATRDVCIIPTNQEDFVYIDFMWLGEQRNMAVFYNGNCQNDYKDVYPKPAILCSVGKWGFSGAFMTQLAEEFKGFVRLDDCSGEWEEV